MCFGQDLAAGELVAQDLAGNEDIGAVKAGTSSSDDLPYAPGLGTAEGRRYAVAAFPFRTKGEGSAGDTVGVEVVAMDAESGQEAWRTKWDLPKSYDTHLVTYVAGVTGRTAVVVSHGENRYPVTYGIDLVTHKVTWSETAFKAQLVQGTRVLGQRRGAEDALKLAAVDGGRGRDLWTGMEVGEDRTVRTFAPDSAWVGDPEGRAVIDSATSHGLNRTAPTPQLSAQTSGNASVSGGGGPAGRDRLHDRAGPISRCGGPRAGGAPPHLSSVMPWGPGAGPPIGCGSRPCEMWAGAVGRDGGVAVRGFPARKKECREHRDAGQEYERHDVAAIVGAWAGCRPAVAAARRRWTARERLASLTRRPCRGHDSRTARSSESQKVTCDVSSTRPV
ncbi:hypothetical protein GCM10017674_58030 [Streptomyces gardneri]|uniref:Uncharacterized protein n=1 Tax=Streptomyces gardneri TaxID=66892 RepID=A0A4Y3RNF6_9ACTN|nr:hypothetical protein SGA01_46900 [Streptomyces gardneri]GHH12181.1 hypothetical protein GCM10017674_58030 [Streptomyces gardneri]